MKQKNNFLGKLKRYRVLLLMLLPAVLYVILFKWPGSFWHLRNITM